jgi:CelD/BcsL family acetyltransferase involved in cellulose biosynthesis
MGVGQIGGIQESIRGTASPLALREAFSAEIIARVSPARSVRRIWRCCSDKQRSVAGRREMDASKKSFVAARILVFNFVLFIGERGMKNI